MSNEVNGAKMRETLKRIYDWFDDGGLHEEAADEMDDMLEEAKNALAAPPRNCDVGTAEEQYNRFIYCCTERKISCQKSFSRGCAVCYAKWMQMPYEEGGAK